MTQPQRPSADGVRPRIARTSSLFTRSVRAREGGDARAGGLFDVVVNGAGGNGPWPQYGPFAPRSSDFAGRTASGTVGGRRPGGPAEASVGSAGGLVVIPTEGGAGSASRNVLDQVPEGYEFVRVVDGGILVRPISDTAEGGDEREGPDNGSRYSDGRDGGATSPYRASLQRSIEAKTTSVVGIADGSNVGSLASVLEQLPADVSELSFLFDRASPLALDDLGAPQRTGQMHSKGIYGSADSLERQLPAGQTITSGTNENMMTVSAGLMWLRNLAARDKAAYNKLVVLLRNAGYPGLSADDAELPLNGYTDTVGAAFALAAADLASAAEGGDSRTLMEYLTERGQGYSDMLAQQEADRAAEAEYQPIERRYQDPATLRMALEEAAKATLGRKLSDEEEARFEAHFRGLENGLYDNIDNAGRNQTAWSGYAPDTAGQAWAFLDDPRFETEEAANRIGSYAQSFMRMMGLDG